jgi:CMP-N-acetylneuraminic acid synthetase
LISGSDVLTAILPIRIDQNPFWFSSQGLECVENFLKTCKRVSEIDRFIVITQHDAVRRLAEQHGMDITTVAIPGSTSQAYTFDQTRSLAGNFQSLCNNQTDALIIADHRNLFLSADDIARAHTVYEQNPEAGVISLAFCRDYPCQCKSYYTFLDCVIIHFDESDVKDGISDIPQTGLLREITCQLKCHGKITINVSAKGPRCCIFFHSQNLRQEYYVAQIIPFDANGPLCGQSRETHIPTSDHETEIQIDAAKVTGIIFILTVPSLSGEYDTVEIFTPPNAPWELQGSGVTVVDTKTHEPMFGRQQFPPAYTYDGSLCMLGAKYLIEKATSDPIPIFLEDSCIVTDWVDYWYTVTARETTEKWINPDVISLHKTG